MKTTPPPLAVASWGVGRLDIFGVGMNGEMFHKAWDGSKWFPPAAEWQPLGGAFSSPPAVTSWGAGRLDIFGVGTNGEMFHKAWDGSKWFPPAAEWRPLGGAFSSPPAVTSWGAGRLDIFGVGTNGEMFHKAWDGSKWFPPAAEWQPLGGAFSSPPAVTSWGAGRLDIFGVGTNGEMFHKAWDGSKWFPPAAEWQPLGGAFSSPPAVTSWGAGRLDIFGVGTNGEMFHKAWDGSKWFPPAAEWQPLGGAFSSPPAVTSWGAGRLDIFGVGTNGEMFHKAWDGSKWFPQAAEWQPLGGVFNATPAVASWGAGRLDIFGIGTGAEAYHKAWFNSTWFPSERDWRPLGGAFTPGTRQFPWAVILCRFNGGAGDNNIERFARQAFAPGSGGLVEYWRDVSLGALDISKSQVFGWVELEITRAEAGGRSRTNLVREARKAARNAGIDVETDFSSQIAFFTHDWSRDGVDTSAADRYSYWLDGSSDWLTVSAPPHLQSGSALAHEMGHVHGLGHDYAADLVSAYGDPFCIMSCCGNIRTFDHPVMNKSFGPSVCLPHLDRKGWINVNRLYRDKGGWMKNPDGISVILSPVSGEDAPAHLGIRLSVKLDQSGGWDYYLEYARPIGWNAGLGESRLLVRRLATVGGIETAALLGHVTVPAAVSTNAELIEPMGGAKFTVARLNVDGTIVKVTALKI